MPSPGKVARYWAATIISICILYWRFRGAGPESWYTTLRGGVTKAPESFWQPPNIDEEISKGLAEEEQNVYTQKQSFPAGFPRVIWQTSSEYGREKYADKAQTWKAITDFQYNFLTDEDADEFVHTHFAHRPALVNFWDDLELVIVRADLLRYLTMFAVGGVYSDIDTSCLLHPDQWIPTDLGTETVNVIVGIEYDDTTYRMFVRPISFCQWTLMAKPGHALFESAIHRVMSNLEFIARRRRVTLRELKLDKMEVLEATGPGMITDVVMEVLRDQGQNVTWETFHEMKEARLFGDVLVLPINGFAGGQKHSHAGDPAYGEKYVQHHFGRSWYAPERAGDPAASPADKSTPTDPAKDAVPSTIEDGKTSELQQNPRKD